jgi:membrane protein DedA with SNARE-associated domain
MTLGKKILGFLIAHIHPYGYIILGVITVLEASAFLGILVPGDTVVILSGFLAAQGKMKLPLIVAIASLGGIIGDNIGYVIGRRFGLPFLDRYGKRLHIKERHTRRAERFFQRHGGASVVLGRFVAYIRTFIPVLAGVSRMDYKIFLAYNIVGGILWATVYSAAGYFFGNSWKLISHVLGVTGAVLFLLACIAVGVYITIRRRRSSHP